MNEIVLRVYAWKRDRKAAKNKSAKLSRRASLYNEDGLDRVEERRPPFHAGPKRNVGCIEYPGCKTRTSPSTWWENPGNQVAGSRNLVQRNTFIPLTVPLDGEGT